jgi:hypothetical protein
MRGRNANGSWRDPWDEFEWGGPFVEGGSWQHTWGVPHDPAGLIEAMGGPEPFVARLERMLTGSPHFRVGSYGFEIHEMTEMACVPFGQYAHSNQPVHHALYLFACAGRPDLTQYWVRRVLTELYSPDRFAGDEDNGDMSAWYLFSALGLYPLCPGHPSYILGSPPLAARRQDPHRARRDQGWPVCRRLPVRALRHLEQPAVDPPLDRARGPRPGRRTALPPLGPGAAAPPLYRGRAAVLAHAAHLRHVRAARYRGGEEKMGLLRVHA